MKVGLFLRRFSLTHQLTFSRVPAMPPKQKISWRALYQRINRQLAHEHRQLRTERNTGKHMIVDLQRGAVVDANVEVVALGKKMGVLKAWERA